jgi:hypothetical protein
MFPEWTPYLQKVIADEHRQRLRRVERFAEQRPNRQRGR